MANPLMEGFSLDQFWENRWKPIRFIFPPPSSEESLPFLVVGDEAFALRKYLLRPYPGVSDLND